tara:strand:- start:89025 stop:89636 length:612 start_codon:yes stop_codon:yes gene_type:complete
MKIICIARNYTDHISELSNKKPKELLFFLKPDTSLLLNNKPFFFPTFSKKIDHEVEILVKINKVGKKISKEFANKYYKEISLGIDFTARDIQSNLKSLGYPWEKSKAFDNSAVVGKWISKEKIKNIDDLNFSLLKNGNIVQKESTKNMIWKIDEIISEISNYITLKIGDIIFTGSPAGVGSIKIEDFLEGFIEDKLIFEFKIK